MGQMIVFSVFGEPIPQGSMKAFNVKGRRFPVVTSDNKRLRPWRYIVLEAARARIGNTPPLEGAVRVTLRFFLSRPKSAPKRVVDKITQPDLDKLVRAVLDALTNAGVWKDDAQVTKIEASKAFAFGYLDPANAPPRVEIWVQSIEP